MLEPPAPEDRRQTDVVATGEVIGDDGVPFGESRRTIDAVFELADVAGEGASVQHLERRIGEFEFRPLIRIEPPKELVGERFEVAFALAQRRQKNRHDADAVIEIRAEIAALHRFFEVLVGRADDAHVNLDRAHAADAFKLAFLQNAQQLRLEGRRDLADLVEKQRAAVRKFETTLAHGDGAGEGAFLMTEEFRFEHAFRQRGAVELDEGLGASRREIVDGGREELLAGAGFAAQQNRRFRLGDDTDLVDHRTHRRTVANDALDAFKLCVGHVRPLALLEPGLLLHQPFAVARNEPVQAQCLPDQIGDHGEKAHVVIEQNGTLVVNAIDRQGSDDRVAFLDRNADQRKVLAVRRAPFSEVCAFEQRRRARIVNDERHLGRNNAPDRALWQAIEKLLGGALAPARTNHDFGFAVGVEQRYQSMTHVKETR